MMKNIFRWLFIIIIRFWADAPIFAMFAFLYFQKEGSGGPEDAVFNAAMFFCFAFLHSLLARNFSKAILLRVIGTDYLRSLYVVLSGVTLSLMMVFWRPLA